MSLESNSKRFFDLAGFGKKLDFQTVFFVVLKNVFFKLVKELFKSSFPRFRDLGSKFPYITEIQVKKNF